MYRSFSIVFSLSILCLLPDSVRAELKAGAAIVDVTPSKFPVLVNGGMTSRTASEVTTKINARAIVLDDGRERIGIVVVDSCMIPRPLLDEAKQLAAQQTGLKPNRILVSSTHTHTAPSAMGALGTDADSDYLPVLRAGIAEALAKAEANLEPAEVGWGLEDAADFTALRRWIRRPDRLAEDPFGDMTVRANMHAGRNWDDVTGESGPEDPDLSMISFRAKDGRPIAVLANFSMHYFSGQKALAADYFGLFCDGLQAKLNTSTGKQPPFVGLMSHGCSGDIWRRDYKKPEGEQEPYSEIAEYTDALLQIAFKAYSNISYSADADLAMSEVRPTLNYRVPDKARLEWAQEIVAEMGDRLPKTQSEIYAREQVYLHELQSTEIVVQGLRIGDIGIATTPNETYALTGLKVKLQSPLAKTMVIELANGGDGYIPPPEQHLLGGYNTWAARSAGLEVMAEPKIVEHALAQLEQVSDKPRRLFTQSRGAAAKSIQAAKPVAWWRMDEFSGPIAMDSSGHNRHATYEPAVVYFLDGPDKAAICHDDEVNRAAHFAGGRLLAKLPELGHRYSISMWLWNGMPNAARPTTGWILSKGHSNGLGNGSEHLGLGGTATQPGRLIYHVTSDAGSAPVVGKTEIDRWTWNHVVVVRDGEQVKIYLNGNTTPEVEATNSDHANANWSWFFGGRSDNDSNWEGRLDEIAVFDRALSNAEVAELGKQTR